MPHVDDKSHHCLGCKTEKSSTTKGYCKKHCTICDTHTWWYYQVDEKKCKLCDDEEKRKIQQQLNENEERRKKEAKAAKDKAMRDFVNDRKKDRKPRKDRDRDGNRGKV